MASYKTCFSVNLPIWLRKKKKKKKLFFFEKFTVSSVDIHSSNDARFQDFSLKLADLITWRCCFFDGVLSDFLLLIRVDKWCCYSGWAKKTVLERKVSRNKNSERYFFLIYSAIFLIYPQNQLWILIRSASMEGSMWNLVKTSFNFMKCIENWHRGLPA